MSKGHAFGPEAASKPRTRARAVCMIQYALVTVSPP